MMTIEIIYDGDCPFCSRYVRLLRLRQDFDVTFTNGREHPERAAELKEEGYDLAEGMVVRVDESIHYGADAINVLSLMSSPSGRWNRVLATVFRHKRASAALYPILRLGRNAALFALGRKRTFRA